jgi:hypothetical protein
MKIGYIEFPELLIDAEREEKLVVFAGAGVSIDRPSSLPSFEELVKQVAGGSLAKSKGEPADVYLGRLASQGVDVHGRVKDIINKPRSIPNRLHRTLVSLFPTPGRVRIVTTNFDRHFSSAANDLFKAHVDEFYAPALPLGYQFNGIVYLHGSIERPADSLVLTDSDFGRAYLTDGWARHFLQGLFTAYKILFVGYSHDDTVMKYLSRALPPGLKTRFAVTTEGKDENWKYLGIAPVSYSKAKGRYPHSPLRKSMEDWGKHARSTALEHERKIKDMVSLPPPIDLVEHDYLKNELRKLECVRFFTGTAGTADWLKWAEENSPAFRTLFTVTDHNDDISQEFARWFASFFVSDECSDEALALVTRRGNTISPLLWQNIARHLSYGKRPSRLTYAKWVSILLPAPPQKANADALSTLLKGCKFPDDKEIAILLFENITSPRLILSHRFALTSHDQLPVYMEASLQGETYWLYESWNTFFKPNIAHMIDSLLPIVESNLRKAYLLLQSTDQLHEDFDPLSASRHAIEKHEQDKYRTKDYVLIDAARDIMEFLSVNRFSEADQLIQRWSVCNLPLLQRLAIHGMIESASRSPDEKISWLLSTNWLYRASTKHEAFRLLKISYPNSSDAVRSKLLIQAMVGPKIKKSEKDAEQRKRYAVYNLLTWLYHADPSYTIIKKNLEKIQKDYPNFKPRDYPDLNSWSTFGFHRPDSPLTVDELLGSNPEYAINFLLCYQEDEFRLSREGLLDTLIKATIQSYDWSIKLALVLLKNTEMETALDVWKSLLQGWKSALLSDQQWGELLDMLNEHPELMQLAEPVIDLVKHGLTAIESNIPLSYVPDVEILTDVLWREAVGNTMDVNEQTDGDWLIAAINHPGGEIVEMWLHILSRIRAKSLETWVGIPAAYKVRFLAVISGESIAASLGRVLLASQIHFLHSLDAKWTENNIIPLLNWDIDEKRAEQAWHGYLTWAELNNITVPLVMPLYIQTFRKFLSRLPDDLRGRFCGHLASIAIFGAEDLLKDGWITNFLKSGETKDRVSFASAVETDLASVGENEKKKLWDRWLNRYWADRITGIPVPITVEEQKYMILWSVELEPVFDQVIEKICSSQAPNLTHTHFYHLLDERQFASKHPAAISKLLIHLLQGATEPFWYCKELGDIVQSLLRTSQQRSDLILICNQLARLGCASASALGEICESTPPPSE